MKLRNIVLSLSALVLFTLPTVDAQEDKPAQGKGWQTINGQQYFIKEDGSKVTSSWIDHSYVDKDGKKVVGSFIYDETYKSYFYLKADGNYAENQWLEIGGKWYYFKEWGYMAKSEWKGNYYLNPSGAMAKKEWIYDNKYNSYFYLKADGKYADKEWIQDGNKWYYLLSGGYLATHQWISDYFVNGEGAMMAKEWLFDPQYNAMFYLNADGKYARNQWVQIDGNWYYFKANGARAEK